MPLLEYNHLLRRLEASGIDLELYCSISTRSEYERRVEPPYEGAEEGLRIEISIRTYGSDRNAVEILTPLAEAIGTRN